MQEREMIDLLLEKDERGMAELMRQYAPLLKYIIAPIVADAHEREDCLSEISLIIWDKIGLFDPEKGSLRAYLTAIARNAAVSHAKRLGRHTHEELPAGEARFGAFFQAPRRSCALFHVRSRPSPPNALRSCFFSLYSRPSTARSVMPSSDAIWAVDCI